MTRRDDATTAMTIVLAASTISLVIGAMETGGNVIILILAAVIALCTMMVWKSNG